MLREVNVRALPVGILFASVCWTSSPRVSKATANVNSATTTANAWHVQLGVNVLKLNVHPMKPFGADATGRGPRCELSGIACDLFDLTLGTSPVFFIVRAERVVRSKENCA